MERSPASVPVPPDPRRTGWPYIVGAVLTIAIQSDWSPAEVCALAAILFTLVAVIYATRE